MGVPSFYRWLVDKYPSIVVKAIEEKGECIDISLPNPNGIEFDNLYLDMNGIIHPCFHPDDHPSPPTTFDDVFNSIYEYIDHIFSIVRPRKLLYMAIDGVAPRAKMNQQRSRRFQSAKTNEILEEEEVKLRKQFEMKGKQVLPKLESEVSDSNIITPGTEFMFQLSRNLQNYISSRMNANAGWKGIKVVLSDSNVPGEGEHKIMSFIRQQRALPYYNPNTSHCLYGLDADLIMLALATHEVHFSILREDVCVQEQQAISLSALQTNLCRVESSSMKSKEWFRDVATQQGQLKDDETTTKSASFHKNPYQFLHVWILREYLELDLKIADLPDKFTLDFERIVDDFIFLCFFAGNDFLPHMPTLEIHEGAIDLLMTVYKKEFKNLGGYLVDVQRVKDPKNAYVKLKRVEKFILQVGTYEEKIFKKRSELHEKKLKRLCEYSDAQEEDDNESENLNNSCSSPDDTGRTSTDLILENTKKLQEELKLRLRKRSDLFKNGGSGTDKVKLGTFGWKERYYEEKFSAEGYSNIASIRKELVQKYTEGLLWVLLYYFSGVPSWTWFYPYHHGPFSSDLKGLAQVKVKFNRGSPFKPFDQLMGVLPPRSVHALPKAYQALMTDDDSRIIDFYPAKFEIDMVGKRYTWQGICKLPFINEEQLLAETKKVEKELEMHEAERNAENVDKLFIRRSSMSESEILSLTSKLVTGMPNELVKIDPSMSIGIGGSMRLCAEDFSMVDSTIHEKLWNNIQERNILCVLFELPNESEHIPHPLQGVEFPPKTITEADIKETQLWHENHYSRHTMRSHTQQRHRKSPNSRHSASIFPTGWTNSSSSVDFYSNSGFGLMHKGAGTGQFVGRGWGRGRGRGSPRHNFREPIEPYRKFALQPDERVAISAPSLGASSTSSCWSNNQNYNNAKYFRPVTRSPDEMKRKTVNSSRNEVIKGVEDMHISESSHSIGSYRQILLANNSFCPSRNGTAYSTNNAWQNTLQYSANTYLRSHGEQWNSAGNRNFAWQHSTHLAANSSREAVWRGNLPPKSSVTGQNSREMGHHSR